MNSARPHPLLFFVFDAKPYGVRAATTTLERVNTGFKREREATLRGDVQYESNMDKIQLAMPLQWSVLIAGIYIHTLIGPQDIKQACHVGLSVTHE